MQITMSEHNEKLPIVSICILTSNSAITLGRVLEAVLNLDYPKKNIELIFVDNDSQDETPKIIKQFIETHGTKFINVIYLTRR